MSKTTCRESDGGGVFLFLFYCYSFNCGFRGVRPHARSRQVRCRCPREHQLTKQLSLVVEAFVYYSRACSLRWAPLESLPFSQSKHCHRHHQHTIRPSVPSWSAFTFFPFRQFPLFKPLSHAPRRTLLLARQHHESWHPVVRLRGVN